MNDLIINIDKLHTTRMSAEKIRRNLGIRIDPIVCCKRIIIGNYTTYNEDRKNWYVEGYGCRININKKSYTIIAMKRI